MKIEKKLISLLENCDAFYILGVSGENNFSSIQGKYNNELQTIHHIVQGMLGVVKKTLDEKEAGNAVVLILLIQQAFNLFPELSNLKVKK